MDIWLKGIFFKIRTEPPVTAAFFTVVAFSCPIFISIIQRGYVLLPTGYTYTAIVYPIYGLLAILIDLLLVYLFSRSPVIRLNFHSIITPDIFRKVLIIAYILITWVSFLVINARLDFFNSLLDDPLITMLKVGGDIVEQNLLRSFFLGISGCIAYALTKNTDGILLRFASLFTAIVIVIFYFFIGRRESSLTTLCFLLLVKRAKIGRVYVIVVGVILATVLVFVLTLRLTLQNNSESLFATNSEELSPVAYSSYIIQATPPNVARSVKEVTPLRPYLFPNTISADYIKAQTGYNDTANPVLGIGGITYMYGFILPVIMLLIIGSFFRSVTREFKIKKTPILKLLLIFITFKSFNLFRNGEYPIVFMDTIKFVVLLLPALYLNFEKRGEIENEQ